MSASATATGLDLWPQDLEPKGQPSPSAILRQQGYRLGERTDQVVYGEVESRFKEEKFVHTLFLAASYLKVRRPVVEIEHGLELYPATAFSLLVDGRRAAPTIAKDALELKDSLRGYFKDPEVVELIQSLLAQARDLDADE